METNTTKTKGDILAERDALRAENAELRKALRDTIGHICGTHPHWVAAANVLGAKESTK